MKNWQTLALSGLITVSLAACSSSDDGTPAVSDDDPIGTTGTTTGATTGATTGTTAGTGSTDGTTGAGTTTGSGVTGGGAGTTTGTTTGAGTTTGSSTTGGDGDLSLLPRTTVAPLDTPAGDPFGYTLEFDPETSVNGIPTKPKNLRADLVSSNWAEFSWAPSNDTGGVVTYIVSRSDGVTYELGAELPAGLSFDGGTYEEYAKYFITTSFIDCNSTRFGFAPDSPKAIDAAAVGAPDCTNTRPLQGETYSYTVSAVDAAGNRSEESDSLEITYASTDAADLSRVDDFIGAFDIVWNDEFDGTAIDPAKWQTTLVFGRDTFINGEQQYFVPVLEQGDRVGPVVTYNPFEFTDEGTLKINAIRTPADQVAALPESCSGSDPILDNDPDRSRCEFLSGALSSHDRMQFTYGYVEGRINASAIPGGLSSFYLYHRYAGSNNPEAGTYSLHGPEIDILEYLGENPFGDADAFQTYHFIDANTGIIRSSPTMNHEKEDGGLYGGAFHTYGVLWEPDLVVWYIDGVEIRRMAGPQVSQQPMNVIDYLVTGSGWALEPADGEADPITLEMDYIRVYKRPQFAAAIDCGVAGASPKPACPAVAPLAR